MPSNAMMPSQYSGLPMPALANRPGIICAARRQISAQMRAAHRLARRQTSPSPCQRALARASAYFLHAAIHRCADM
eukprot:2574292-Karenia_brevis.AAC.1